MNVISSLRTPPGPDNFPHCHIEYKTLDSSQQNKDSVPQLGKPVPFPTEDRPTLSETLIPLDSGYHSLMDASTVAAPTRPFDPWNHIFPQPSVACESFSKQFAMNITSCGDADSSTIEPRTHIPLDYEPDAPTVPLAPAEAPLLASMPRVRECHPTPKVWESTPSHKSNMISSHNDALGVDQGMGSPSIGLNPIPINMTPESLDEVLAPKKTSSLGYPKLVNEDLGPYINCCR